MSATWAGVPVAFMERLAEIAEKAASTEGILALTYLAGRDDAWAEINPGRAQKRPQPGALRHLRAVR